METTAAASPSGFARLFWRDWSTRVTGSLSAVLVVAGLVMSAAASLGYPLPYGAVVQFGTWALAAVSGGLAAYGVWSRERGARIIAEARLLPKIRLFLPPGGVGEAATQTEPSKWIQLTVACETDAHLRNCRVRVKEVVRLDESDKPVSGWPIYEVEHCFWSHEFKHAETIYPGLPLRVNLFSFSRDARRVEVHTHPKRIGFTASIQVPGGYRITAIATATDAAPCEQTFLLKWNNFDDVSFSEFHD